MYYIWMCVSESSTYFGCGDKEIKYFVSALTYMYETASYLNKFILFPSISIRVPLYIYHSYIQQKQQAKPERNHEKRKVRKI